MDLHEGEEESCSADKRLEWSWAEERDERKACLAWRQEAGGWIRDHWRQLYVIGCCE